MSNFWEDVMPGGYYDEVLLSGIKAGRGIQPNWHNITFLEVGKYVEEDLIHLDYACGPGTFIGNYLFNNSLGVDISNEQIKYANKNYGNKARFLNLEEYENNEESEIDPREEINDLLSGFSGSGITDLQVIDQNMPLSSWINVFMVSPNKNQSNTWDGYVV